MDDLSHSSLFRRDTIQRTLAVNKQKTDSFMLPTMGCKYTYDESRHWHLTDPARIWGIGGLCRPSWQVLLCGRNSGLTIPSVHFPRAALGGQYGQVQDTLRIRDDAESWACHFHRPIATEPPLPTTTIKTTIRVVSVVAAPRCVCSLYRESCRYKGNGIGTNQLHMLLRATQGSGPLASFSSK